MMHIDIASALFEIHSTGISESNFCTLHKCITHEHPWMGGVYRTLPIQAGKLNLPLAFEVPNLMRTLFECSDFKTLHGCVVWFVQTLEGIHPFFDGNRRTCFLGLEAQLRYIGYTSLSVGEHRDVWERISYSRSGLPEAQRINMYSDFLLSIV
jgi:hypothetical protein